jgi:hypothetical protein
VGVGDFWCGGCTHGHCNSNRRRFSRVWSRRGRAPRHNRRSGKCMCALLLKLGLRNGQAWNWDATIRLVARLRFWCRRRRPVKRGRSTHRRSTAESVAQRPNTSAWRRRSLLFLSSTRAFSSDLLAKAAATSVRSLHGCPTLAGVAALPPTVTTLL